MFRGKTMTIPEDVYSKAENRFKTDRANIVAKNAVSSAGIRAAARVPEAIRENAMSFDIDLKQGDRTSQTGSGRCWMFASLNTMRQRVIEKYNLSTLELSECYPMFFDKLEKSNWFLSNIIDTVDEPLDGRLVSFLLEDPVQDGGQWDMFRSLVNKYGVCPKEFMPETACSSNTAELRRYLTRYLRGCAHKIRTAHEGGASFEELDQIRKDSMVDVYSFLVICLGEPPKSFDLNIRDKDHKLVISGNYTPCSFFKEIVDIDIDSLVSCINSSNRELMKTYTISRLGNVCENGLVRYLNLPLDRLKELALAQLKDGRPVWFGCDVSQAFIREDGIMDTAALDFDNLFGFPVEGNMNRSERLDYGESDMSHAMVLEGAKLDENGKPILWKVENSWGADHGRDGFDTLSDAWFDEYLYQVVVDKKYLSEEELSLYENCEPCVLPPWDPMGSLA